MQGTTEDERERIVQRSKLFFFNRYVSGSQLTRISPSCADSLYLRSITGSSLTLEEVLRHQEQSSLPAQASSEATPQDSGDDAPTLSFAELKELIESGKTDKIPNNRQIPHDVHVSDHTTPVSCLIDVDP